MHPPAASARIGRQFAALVLLLVGWVPAQAEMATLAATPNLTFGNRGSVYAVLRLPDGGLVVGGDFEHAYAADGPAGGGDPFYTESLARFDADGQLLWGWEVDTDGYVRALVADGTGNVYVGGDFSTINGEPRKNLAKVSLANGVVDPDWTPNPDSTVHALAVTADGSLFVGGDFVTIGGLLRQRLAKVDGGGRGLADPTWKHNANGIVWALAIGPDGQLYAGGDFYQIGNALRQFVARLSTASGGNLDPGWLPEPNATVYTIAFADDGSPIIGGRFSQVAGQPRYCLAKISAAGSGLPDANWNPAPNNSVFGLTRAASGELYAGGAFTEIGGQAHRYAARLSAAGIGTVDPDWSADSDSHVVALATGDDGVVHIGGVFNTINGEPSLAAASVSSIDGTPVHRYLIERPGDVSRVFSADDGSVFVSGYFDRVSTGSTHSIRDGFARITPFGAVDPWDPAPNGIVSALLVDSDGSIFVGGQFSRIGGAARARLARFLPSGDIDHDWNPGANGTVATLAIEGAALYAGGEFSTIGGQPRNGLAMLATSSVGQVDADWNPNPQGGSVGGVALDAQGALYAYGTFQSVGGVGRAGLAKMSASGNGNVDTEWDPAPDDHVHAIGIGADGAVFVGGRFQSIGGRPQAAIAKLSPATTGAADASWAPVLDHDVVSLAFDPRGGLYIAGVFWMVDGVGQRWLARLSQHGVGQLDGAWLPEAGGIPGSLASTRQGGVVVAGHFYRFAGDYRQFVAALLPATVFADGFQARDP